MTVRSCFAGLADGLREHLVEGTWTRQLFDYHRVRMEALFASQPDLPLHQDTVAGFLQGFLTTAAYFVPDDSVEQESMFPVFGGALLLGQDLPIDTSPAGLAVEPGFARAEVRVPLAEDDARARKAGVHQGGRDRPRARGQEPRVREEKRPQASSVIESIRDNDGNPGRRRVGAETSLQLVVLTGASVTVVLRTAQQLHNERTFLAGGRWPARKLGRIGLEQSDFR